MAFSSVSVVTNSLMLKKYKSLNSFTEIQKVADKEKVNMKTVEIMIDGMSCQHCAASEKKAVQSVYGLSNVDVILEEKKALISVNEFTDLN